MSKLSDKLKNQDVKLPETPTVLNLPNEPKPSENLANTHTIIGIDRITRNNPSKSPKMVLIDDKYKTIIENLAFISKTTQTSILNNILSIFLEETGELSLKEEISNYINEKLKM